MRKRQRVEMQRKIVDLEDDMKEYWGFYLLDNSFFRWMQLYEIIRIKNLVEDCRLALDMKERQ